MIEPKPETWCKPWVRKGSWPASDVQVSQVRDSVSNIATNLPLGDRSGLAQYESENWPGAVSWRKRMATEEATSKERRSACLGQTWRLTDR